MEKIRLSEIIKWCRGKVDKKINDSFVKAISTDSREIIKKKKEEKLL